MERSTTDRPRWCVGGMANIECLYGKHQLMTLKSDDRRISFFHVDDSFREHAVSHDRTFVTRVRH